jgi:hypothetical protein
MAKTLHIGKLTTEQIITIERSIRRDMDLEENVGFVSKHKVHKSKKTYTRKDKHKK